MWSLSLVLKASAMIRAASLCSRPLREMPLTSRMTWPTFSWPQLCAEPPFCQQACGRKKTINSSSIQSFFFMFFSFSNWYLWYLCDLDLTYSIWLCTCLFCFSLTYNKVWDNLHHIAEGYLLGCSSLFSFINHFYSIAHIEILFRK